MVRGGPVVELKLESRTEGSWTVLDVDGEVDLSTASSLRARVEELIHDGARRLVVSLEDVGFLDSSGLSVLVGSLKRMREAGGELAIVCSRDSVLKVFTVTGLDRILTMYRSVDEAVSA